jgi:glycosyltransferase involved in cell wall biosynthesis
MAEENSPGSKAATLADPCTVVIPCYNEAARLPVGAFEVFLRSEASRGIRLLFVNDGSRDGTLAVLETLRAQFPERVCVLDQQPNRGKAEAVRQGMLRAIAEGQAAVTGFWDADLATPLDQIPEFLRLLAARPELHLVLGARVRLLGRRIQRQPLRHYLGRCFATVVSLMLHMPVYDTQCGAKLFRITPELRQVLAEPFHSRWIFDVEILARYLAFHRGDAHALETEMYEYPLPAWTDVAGSKVRSTDFLRALGELAAIYRRYLAK